MIELSFRCLANGGTLRTALRHAGRFLNHHYDDDQDDERVHDDQDDDYDDDFERRTTNHQGSILFDS